jgi:hypothetical protein
MGVLCRPEGQGQGTDFESGQIWYRLSLSLWSTQYDLTTFKIGSLSLSLWSTQYIRDGVFGCHWELSQICASERALKSQFTQNVMNGVISDHTAYT